MEKNNTVIKIGIFYDGNYFLNASNYYNYVHPRRQHLNISGLQKFVANKVAQEHGIKLQFCQVVDAHFFKGRKKARDLNESRLYYERVIDDTLTYLGVTTHYLPIRYQGERMYEKGIDVWLSLEAFELSLYRKFDVLVLVASDGDYVPLVRKLHTLGIKVMLISWEFDYYNEDGGRNVQRTSGALMELVTYPVVMNEFIDKNKGEMTNSLFVESYKPEPEAPAEPKMLYQHSTIHAIKSGYGFIKWPGNNLFFHYSSVLNADFNGLLPGDVVEFVIGKNDKGEDVAFHVKRKYDIPKPDSIGFSIADYLKK